MIDIGGFARHQLSLVIKESSCLAYVLVTLKSLFARSMLATRFLPMNNSSRPCDASMDGLYIVGSGSPRVLSSGCDSIIEGTPRS